MRRSGDVTGWAFLAEVDGVRHAGLAVGQAGLGPFTGAGPGGSLAALAYVRGLPTLTSLDALPLVGPMDARWCVHRDAEGVVSVFGPGGLQLAYDLALDLPPGWLESVTGTGSLVLVVSHALPSSDDMAAVLTYETQHGMVCAGRVRFGPPGDGTAGPPTFAHVLDPVSVLLELVLHVRDRVLSLDAAGRRARELERTRRSLGEDHWPTAGALLELLVAEADRSRGGSAELRYLYWRLVVEVAEECGVDAVWREAALRTVESAAPVLAERCERPVFEDADELAGRLIERLEGASGGSPGGTSGGAPGLAAALLAAARLRLAVRGPEDLGGDAYAGAEGTVRAAQFAVDLYRSPLYRPWFGGAWPLRFDARLRDEARELLLRAVGSDDREGGPGGALRPRILAALAQVAVEEVGGAEQEAVAEESGGEEEHGGVDRATVRAAFDALLDLRAAGPPDLTVFLLRAVDDVPASFVDVVRENVFGSDVPAFLAAHGGAVAARTVDQGISLARERADRPLLRAALDWADRSPLLPGPAHRRQQIEARLHALPDDPTDCPGPGPLPESFPADWTPAQRSAALLHTAAHARDRRQPALGAALLRQARPGDGAGVRLLTADLHRLAVEQGEPVAGPVPFPWGHSTYAALSYASLNQQDLAQACLLPVLHDLPRLRGEDLRNAVYAIIVDLPNFDTSGAPALGEVLRDLVHAAVWQLTVEIESMPVALMLGLHQAGKGPEAGAWRRIDGAITRPAHIENYIGKLRALESPTAVGGATTNLLDVLDGDHRPGGTGGTGGTGGEGDEGAEVDDDREEFARNLRRLISSFIDDELRSRSAAFVDDEHVWARTGELLDDRTVLLTWFLPTAVNGAAVLLAVTREGSTITVQLGDGDGDGYGDDGDGGPEGAAVYADRHPVADLVEAVRTEVERDPLFGEVTPEGRRLLTGHELPLPDGDQLAAWRARDKDRLLLWPHGALHYLPVALCSAGGRTIADDWTVVTVAGLEALLPAVGPVRPRRTAVLASGSGGVPYGLPAEPALEEHARTVAAAVGAHALTGPAATRAGLLAELATADVVHLAVHGTMDQDAPWLHCLYFTPDEDDDGRLFAHDFLELDLSGVRLVTLAACESALGRFDRADNVRGVPAALITAGVQAVVGCLWAVRPEPATYFFQRLHRRADLADAPEQAFRAAQTATRARYPQYRDWGAFTCLLGRSKGATA
ncbi:CHAT domain-containing protein [Streptomyces sp. TRM75563]|uniref:CHAT domain-containing protein n=1 Tax=Streptomyces sp. TRM75563 TaxID=2817418 RepID=UPI001F613637|nr:CHAT domain-containing protein [Streptomyces sp. TRM75563]MCI4044724.1 CHAT domain-containing protein [Streptomyces sp. TRM75563]